MFARHVVLRLRADSVAKFADIINNEVTPLLRQQAGFFDQITLISPERAEAVVITFWDNKQSEESFNRTQNPEVLKSLLGAVEGTPKVNLFEVMNSTSSQHQGGSAR